MWARYGKDGVAIVSRYDLLKQVLDPLSDKVMVGLIRYGSAHLTGWNVIRFVTTKRENYSPEREVRATISVQRYWRRDQPPLRLDQPGPRPAHLRSASDVAGRNPARD
jgi:hypothetical protein